MKKVCLMSMLVIGIITILTIFWVLHCCAADVELKWDAVTGATGYKIYKSEDSGTTWATPIDVGNVTTYKYLAVIETKLILFRASAYNTNGETIRYHSGAWYDHRKLPLGSPQGTGIK